MNNYLINISENVVNRLLDKTLIDSHKVVLLLDPGYPNGRIFCISTIDIIDHYRYMTKYEIFKYSNFIKKLEKYKKLFTSRCANIDHSKLPLEAITSHVAQTLYVLDLHNGL